MRFSNAIKTGATGFSLLFSMLVVFGNLQNAYGQPDPQTRHYQKVLRPVMVEHCFDCHNGGDKKAGLNLEDVYFASSIIRNGRTWVKVIEEIKSGNMPPHTKPRISEEDKELLLTGIETLLDSALSIPDPGRIVMRRLSNREYHYNILDLTGIDFDARTFFPRDASGGGFDNHGGALYITPLQMERYMEAADTIVTQLYRDQLAWGRVVPAKTPKGFFAGLVSKSKALFQDEALTIEAAKKAAVQQLYPFATQAYRRFISQSEKEQLQKVFSSVFKHVQDDENGFDIAMQETLKYILVSPNFLYRREANIQASAPYQVTDFELASRLSYFLWSSTPDQILLNLAYRGELHDPVILRAQLERMVQDPKSRRMAESFTGQWLEVEKILEDHQVDSSIFPAYSASLRDAFYDEVVTFFHHIITSDRGFLDLLDSDYSFLNDELASHYGLNKVGTSDLTLTYFPDDQRGGLLGMGSILTATSLPTRTSPVLRGKWVLEQLLGTPPPPPPPDVPELTAPDEEHVNELDLRAMLTKHRAPSTCFACHQKMDPLGLGLENFNAIGAWRDKYGTMPVDASGVLPNGDRFNGPAQLRETLLKEKRSFARNFSRRMLGFALGRSVRFEDKKTVDALTNSLLENDF
ncbi:MAG: DUF1592 domain-containing protein, partial [Rhodothermales bacterium]